MSQKVWVNELKDEQDLSAPNLLSVFVDDVDFGSGFHFYLVLKPVSNRSC